MSTADPLFPASASLPLGAPFGRAPVSDVQASASRPFGMRRAVVPQSAEIDAQDMRYDPITQTALIQHDGAWIPVARHSTGTTHTNTSDGKGGPDSDSDHTED